MKRNIINNHKKYTYISFVVTIIFIIGFLGLSIGSFADGKISEFLAGDASHSKTCFGGYFSPFAGILATFVFIYVTSILILCIWGYKNIEMWLKISISIVSIFCIYFLIIGQAYDSFIKEIYNAFSIPEPSKSLCDGLNITMLCYSFVVATIILVAFVGLNITILKKYQKQLMVGSIWAFFTMISSYLVIYIMKNNIHRERYYQIIVAGSDPVVQFKNGYSLLGNMNTLSDGSFSVEKMNSFPSGHTNWAMVLLIFIPLLNTIKNTKYFILKYGLTFLILIFIIILMFSRIQTGSHYLSDVAMSVVINAICFIATFGLIYLINNNIKNISYK